MSNAKLAQVNEYENRASVAVAKSRSWVDGTVRRSARLLVSFTFVFGVVPSVTAQPNDLAFADVTARAFSVIWVSDEPVEQAGVRVFRDSEGLDEVTADVQQQLLSPQEALDNGIVKITVWGLAPDTSFFVETETLGVSGTQVVYPEASAPLLEVTTALGTRKADDLGQPIINDLITHQTYIPAGAPFAEGTLVLVKVPQLSEYPISAFVGEAGIDAVGMVDLNNVFADTDGLSSQTMEGQQLEIAEYRGLHCNALDQVLLRLRRVPAQDEIPWTTDALPPADCFGPSDVYADLDCDGRIGLVDFTRFLSKFQLEAQDCRFNPDMDLDGDGRVGLVDFTRFLSVFGSVE